MNAPTLDTLFGTLEATWPPARTIELPPFRLRHGKGGGQRVSSAIANGVVSDSDIDAAEQAMTDLGQPTLFMIRESDGALDRLLETRGYAIKDPTVLYLINSETIAKPPRTGQVFPTWPPFAVQRDIWASGGIDDARLAIMHRTADPRTSLLCRAKDTPAATAFVATHQGVAMLHALEVAPAERRKGVGEKAVRASAHWAMQNGADWLTLAVVAANAPARSLYGKLGMSEVGSYHYRRAPEVSP